MGNDSFEILIKNKIDEIQRVYARLEEFVGSAKLQENITGKINMVFDELLSNIIQYGYQDSNEHEIKIMVKVIDSKMRVQIEDEGVAFNPFEVRAPDTNVPFDDRDIGGLGIHLTQSVMDECQYQRMGNKNIVTLVKHLDE